MAVMAMHNVALPLLGWWHRWVSKVEWLTVKLCT